VDRQEILENLATAVLEGNDDLARENARRALDAGLDPLMAMEEGISRGMTVIGRRFEAGEAFLPELLMAADTFAVAMEIFKPAIDAAHQDIAKAGKVVIATVKGDVHNLGKNIVATVLETNGFEVVDLGIDQSTLNIIEAADRNKADIIALSSVMTTTMPYQKEVIATLQEMGKRENHAVLVGGGPVSQQWADEIGADGYGASAMGAVELARQQMARRV
jgi:trimethylamine corrinoid protein